MIERCAPSERKLVLVVEDNDVNRFLVGEMLRRVGFDVQFANDGVEAIELCRRRPPDAVLMDVHMPRMDGVETTVELRRLQQAGELPGFPIIGATADATRKAACLAAGMDAFMTKPLEMTRLRDEIENLTVPHDPN
jgi:two-component system capsular synthesis sensor histidine kinase RcsC